MKILKLLKSPNRGATRTDRRPTSALKSFNHRLDALAAPQLRQELAKQTEMLRQTRRENSELKEEMSWLRDALNISENSVHNMIEVLNTDEPAIMQRIGMRMDGTIIDTSGAANESS